MKYALGNGAHLHRVGQVWGLFGGEKEEMYIRYNFQFEDMLVSQNVSSDCKRL